jgi:hypothetical protein
VPGPKRPTQTYLYNQSWETNGTERPQSTYLRLGYSRRRRVCFRATNLEFSEFGNNTNVFESYSRGITEELWKLLPHLPQLLRPARNQRRHLCVLSRQSMSFRTIKVKPQKARFRFYEFSCHKGTAGWPSLASPLQKYATKDGSQYWIPIPYLSRPRFDPPRSVDYEGDVAFPYCHDHGRMIRRFVCVQQ